MDAVRTAQKIIFELQQAGHIAYFAGGWVRDYLLGIASQDIDIATSALPQEIVQIFPDHVLVGAQFGVVLVLYNNFQYEVATFRQDLSYTDGRKPSEIILKSTPIEDAKRRDFTINGMFFNPATNEVFDYIGGKEDLEKKIIRTIGNPKERFTEDRLRMIRAVRFAYKFGFEIEDSTREAIKGLSKTLFPAVSMERIWQEFSKMRESPFFVETLIEMHKLKLLPTIFPFLSDIPVEDISSKLQVLKNLQKHVPCILFLAELCSEYDLKFTENLYTYLRASKEEGRWIDNYLYLKKIFPKNLYSYELYELAKIYSESRSEICFEVLASKLSRENKKEWDAFYITSKHKLEHHIHRLRKKDLIVTSHDLKELGISPGKKMGMLLETATRIAINNEIHDKKEVLKLLTQTPEWITND